MPQSVISLSNTVLVARVILGISDVSSSYALSFAFHASASG